MGARLMVCPWTGKKIFWQEGPARKERNRLARHGMEMRHYSCPKCHYWHLSTINKKKKREKPDESLPD